MEDPILTRWTEMRDALERQVQHFETRLSDLNLSIFRRTQFLQNSAKLGK